MSSEDTVKEWKIDDLWDLWIANDLKCNSCRSAVKSHGVLRSHDHPGGLKVTDFKEPQWIFSECNACGYGTSMMKFSYQIKNKQMQKKLDLNKGPH